MIQRTRNVLYNSICNACTFSDRKMDADSENLWADSVVRKMQLCNLLALISPMYFSGMNNALLARSK